MESTDRLFKVTVVSASNVWNVDSKDLSITGKAAVSIRFPGQDDGSLYQSDAVPPLDPRDFAPESASANSSLVDSTDNVAGEKRVDTSPEKGSKGSKAKKDQSRSDERLKEQESSVATLPWPASFAFGAVAEFTRTSDWLLWHNLVNTPLAISLLWLSPSSQTVAVVGTVKVDLSELLLARVGLLEQECAIEPANPTEHIDSKTSGGKKDGALKAPAKGKKGILSEEGAPLLIEGATLKVQVSTDSSILSDIDRQEGVLLEFDKFCVDLVPPRVLECSTVDTTSTYTLAFQIPGFSGPWWDSLTAVRQEAKDSFAVARIQGGVLAFVPSQSSATSTGETRLTAASVKKASQLSPEENAVTTQSGSLPVTAGADPSAVDVNSPCNSDDQKKVITWGSLVKRFLPSEGAKELKESISRKKNWHGEFARNSSSQQGVFDPYFERDHKIVRLNLSSLIEEGSCEITICTPLEDFCNTKQLLQKCEKLDDHSKASPVDEVHIVNETNELRSQLIFHVKASRPLQPVWVAPPVPEMKLTDVLTGRPKLTKFNDKLEVELKEFQKLVNVGAQAIFSLQRKILSEDNPQLVDQIHAWNNRQSFLRISLFNLELIM